MKEYEDLIRDYLIERKWDNLRPGDIAKSISIESAELLELFQWTNPSLTEVKNNPELLDNIKEEIADVFIYCFEITALLNLDTSKIIKDKLEIVKTKYPAELFRNRHQATDAGSEDIYWEIKQNHRKQNKD